MPMVKKEQNRMMPANAQLPPRNIREWRRFSFSNQTENLLVRRFRSLRRPSRISRSRLAAEGSSPQSISRNCRGFRLDSGNRWA